jgi:hypothetical protein
MRWNFILLAMLLTELCLLNPNGMISETDLWEAVGLDEFVRVGSSPEPNHVGILISDF